MVFTSEEVYCAFKYEYKEFVLLTEQILVFQLAYKIFQAGPHYLRSQNKANLAIALSRKSRWN